jgi:hypothetical protein
MNYKIEKNIPVPTKKGMYPLSEMEIGDSFLIPFNIKPHKIQQRNVYCHLFMVIKHNKQLAGRKCIVRVMGNGIRVWRKE